MPDYRKGNTCPHCKKGILSLWGDCSNCIRVTVTLIPIEVTPKPFKFPDRLLDSFFRKSVPETKEK